MVNVFLFENLILYLLIFMYAYTYMFASFFKNLATSKYTNNYKYDLQMLDSPSVCGLKHTLKFVGKYSYFSDSDLIAAYFYLFVSFSEKIHINFVFL